MSAIGFVFNGFKSSIPMKNDFNRNNPTMLSNNITINTNLNAIYGSDCCDQDIHEVYN